MVHQESQLLPLPFYCNILTAPILTAAITTTHNNHNDSEHMVNVWGYSHVSFFSPMARFSAAAAGPMAAAREFKEMVKA